MLLLLLEMILLVSSGDSVQMAFFRKARKIKDGRVMCAVDAANETKSSSSLQDCSRDCTRDAICTSFNIRNYHICDVYNYKPRVIAPVAGCNNYQVTARSRFNSFPNSLQLIFCYFANGWTCLVHCWNLQSITTKIYSAMRRKQIRGAYWCRLGRLVTFVVRSVKHSVSEYVWTSHGSVYRKCRTDIRYLKNDTDIDVGIWNTEKYRIRTIKYRKVGSVRYFIYSSFTNR